MNTVTDVSRESLTAINLIRTLYCKINTKEYTNNIKLCVYKVSFFLNSKSFLKRMHQYITDFTFAIGSLNVTVYTRL